LDYSTLDDQSIIRLVAQAQPEAMSELYDRYARLVFSLALAILDDRETAEEVTQDVFMRIWEKADSYRPEQARVNTWLTVITRNRSIDRLRQRGKREERFRESWDEASIDGQVRGAERLPEEQVSTNIRAERLRDAIASLPEEQKEALALAYLQGLSHSHIAELLGMPLGTVKTRIRLGMQKLRKIIQEELIV
jgi:RNA polymerase sigma-70 factor, ECF subfamily